MQANDIGDHGAGHLAKLLKTNKTLTSLNISWNKIGEHGIKELSSALNENQSLAILHLGSMHVSAISITL